MFLEYPKWLRLPNGREVIVQDAEQEREALGDAPVAVAAPSVVPEVPEVPEPAAVTPEPEADPAHAKRGRAKK